MKPRICLWLALACLAQAQIEIPGMPGKSGKRAIGGGGSGGAEVTPKESPKARYTTHIVLAPQRQWTSTDGKQLDGKLIAFEDLVTEAPDGATPPPAPEAPKKPTVVRGDKIRLLVKNKPVEVPLARLSQADQDFVARLRKSLETKTPPAP